MRKGNTSQIDPSPRVLIVVDFEDLRQLVAFHLGARGYHVLEAANGAAAIRDACKEALFVRVLRDRPNICPFIHNHFQVSDYILSDHIWQKPLGGNGDNGKL